MKFNDFNMKRYFVAIFFVILSLSCSAFPRNLFLYGGSKGDVYLGCLTCSSVEAESIWNKNGIYGSKYTGNSIWNENGEYGSEYGIYSAFNTNATTPPIVKDMDGRIVGFFTADRFKRGRIETRWILEIFENYQDIREDPSDWFEKNLKAYLL